MRHSAALLSDGELIQRLRGRPLEKSMTARLAALPMKWKPYLHVGTIARRCETSWWRRVPGQAAFDSAT
jgi:hypothetical protein